MNTSQTPANGRNRARRWFRRGHRWIGLSLVVFVVFLSVTGIALNHSGDLELQRRHLDWPWLLDAYGLEVPTPAASFADAGHRATLLGERLFLDGRDTGRTETALTGIATLGPLIAVAGEQSVYVFTEAGEFVEAIDLGSSLPGPIERVGRTRDRAVVQGGGGFLQSDPDIAHFEARDAEPADYWSVATRPDAAEMANLEAAWRGRGVTVERLLLDLHSGRIARAAGPWLMDLVAVFLIVLSVSGIVLSRVRNGRR